MRKVQAGPKNSEPIHQPKPLLPLDCARPALIKVSVNQPTAYSLVLLMILYIGLFARLDREFNPRCSGDL
ncbi:MAG: hypothetical protein ACI9NC_001093 [Verrucomicrobiales bacterium]|jgi:hypothetical protein